MANTHNLFSAFMATLLTVALLLMVEFSTTEQAAWTTATAELALRTPWVPMGLSQPGFA